jgi:hypothetical protein
MDKLPNVQDFIIGQIADFFRENPEMLALMARGYRCGLAMTANEKDNAIRIDAKFASEDGKELTLKELLEMEKGRPE